MKNTPNRIAPAFHNRFFYISFFLMLAFSVFGVFFMELPRESGFDLWRQYRFDENGAPLTTLFFARYRPLLQMARRRCWSIYDRRLLFSRVFSLHGSIFHGLWFPARLRKPYDFERR